MKWGGVEDREKGGDGGGGGIGRSRWGRRRAWSGSSRRGSRVEGGRGREEEGKRKLCRQIDGDLPPTPSQSFLLHICTLDSHCLMSSHGS